MSYTRKLTQIVLSIIMVLSMGISLAQLETASAQSQDGLKRQFNAQTGKVSFIGPESGRALPAANALGTSSVHPADPAMALAKRFALEFGLQNPERELSQIKSDHLGNSRVKVRYQQNYQGIPVIGGELIVNTNENGDLYSMNGEISLDLSLLTQPTIDSEQARQTALQSMAKWYQKTPTDFLVTEPELWIYDESLLRPSTHPQELVWRMEVTSVDKSLAIRELVLINAHRGNISLHFNQIDNAWAASKNPGASQTAETALTIKEAPPQAAMAVVKTYTAGNSTVLPGTFLCDQTTPNCTSGSNPHADKAHLYAIGTYNMYQNNHNRNSIDNNNMPVISTVHYDSEYANAFWSGEQMVYGDAYGFALADDVVAHELTHGVTQHESNLFYYYQSGAINEAFSDLWGEYYDQTNGKGTDTAGVRWQIGEDISGLGAIRSMSNPAAFSNPDKMSSVYYSEGEEDNGGVHGNSGINSKAVFLMVDGGTFNGKTVSPLGWVKTAAIYYEVNTNLLSSGADYSDLYYALQQACLNLIGQKGITSGDCTEVKDALDAVEMNMQPAPNFNTDAPVCDVGTPNIIFVDDLENGASKWTFTNGGIVRWQIDSPSYGPYAQSGAHSLYADDFPAAITDAKARLAAFTVPNNAFLHFAHAFGFESFGDPYYFDGGVLEYSINGGSTWLDAGSLINFNGYKGTIYNDWNNPLKGRPAFVGSSHGYISTRLNLASLAGKTVTFRWRMGLDDVVSAWGWWVDNVKVYTCAGSPDTAPPVVQSITRTSANPTSAASVNYTVTFSESVIGVDMADFSLTTAGVTGTVVSGVSGSGKTYTVTVSTGTGNGTIHLDVPVSATITDLAGNPLGSLPFTSGEAYTVQKISTVSPGTYDDANVAWQYAGTWTAYSGVGPYNNTIHYTTTPAATATMVFSGTRFKLTFTKHTNRGSFEVWVDGTLVTTLNASSASLAWQQTYSSPSYINGIHTVVIKNVSTGGKYIDVDAIQIYGESVAVPAGLYDDNNSNWIYTGTWTVYNSSGPFANTLHYTGTVGDSAELLFTGARFKLLFTKHTNRGLIDVYVDGVKIDTINANSGSLLWQQTYLSPVLTTGNHRMRLVYASGGTYIDIDAIQIYAPVSTGTYDDANSNWVYSGAWTVYNSSGPYANTMHYTGTISNSAELLFTGTRFALIYTKYFNRGLIDVFVDGVKITTINANSASLQWQQTYTSPVLAAGNHLVRFVHAGASGTYIDVDAITILP